MIQASFYCALTTFNVESPPDELFKWSDRLAPLELISDCEAEPLKHGGSAPLPSGSGIPTQKEGGANEIEQS